MSDLNRRTLGLDFTASGSEYFRIWIVNLLLIVVTLGFYLPFAKARRLQYFYANTRLDGQALAFHGDPWRMLRGYSLMLVLFGGYALSGHFSPWAGLGMFALLMLLWPALWRSSLRFRLHNTSWRGLRFGFTGTLADAYRTMLPLFIPGLIILATSAWFISSIEGADPAAMKRAVNGQIAVGIFSLLAMAVIFPYGLYAIKRYQHRGLRYARQQAQFTAFVGPFYKLCFKSIGLGMLGAVALGVVIAIAMPVLVMLGKGGESAFGFAVGFGLVAFYVAVLSLLGAYFSARMQSLVWTATQSAVVTFDSQLKARALAKLTMANFALTVITLGIYRPFAVVNTARLRLAAVAISIEGDVDAWQAAGAQGNEGAAGEMAGDFFGIDMGL